MKALKGAQCTGANQEKITHGPYPFLIQQQTPEEMDAAPLNASIHK